MSELVEELEDNSFLSSKDQERNLTWWRC